MHTFPRPQQHRLHVERSRVDGVCTACGSTDIRSYRVLSEGGWWSARKCQDCLTSLERVPAPPLGSYVPLGSTVRTTASTSSGSQPGGASDGADPR